MIMTFASYTSGYFAIIDGCPDIIIECITEIVILSKCQHLYTVPARKAPLCRWTKYFSFLVLFLWALLLCFSSFNKRIGLLLSVLFLYFFFSFFFAKETPCALMLVRFYDDYFPHLTFLLLFVQEHKSKAWRRDNKTKTEDLEIFWFNLESPTT